MTGTTESFGQRVKQLREQRGMTRDTLAHLVGATGNAVYHWELGRTHPHHDTYTRLAEALQTTCDYLMSGQPVVETTTGSCGVCERPIANVPVGAGALLCPLCASHSGLVRAFREGLARKADEP